MTLREQSPACCALVPCAVRCTHPFRRFGWVAVGGTLGRRHLGGMRRRYEEAVRVYSVRVFPFQADASRGRHHSLGKLL